MNIILFYPGLGKRGGITPDVRYLEAELRKHGHQVRSARTLTQLLRGEHGPGTLVNIYGCVPSFRLFLAIISTRARRQRFIWTPVFHPRRQAIWQGAGPYRVMKYFDRAAPRLARIAHGVSAATPAEAEFFRSMGARRVAVVPLVAGDRHARFEGVDRLRARHRLGLGSEPVVLIIAAHSPRRKGLDFAANVLSALRADLPEATYLLVGGGDLGPLAGLPGVRALGWCPDELLQDAYRCADVLFVPSIYEQFSRVTIEAWACELPVVLTDGVALAPMAEQADAGRVVTFGDVAGAAAELRRALTDPDWCRLAGKRGQQLVAEHFLPATHLRATLELYSALR